MLAFGTLSLISAGFSIFFVVELHELFAYFEN